MSLNHFSAIIDRDLAQAMERSAFLREFANFRVDTISVGDESWTGRNLLGRSTYVEFFTSVDLPGEPENRLPGRVSIALGGDSLGVLDAVDHRAAQMGLATFRKSRQRLIDDRPVDWFVTTRLDIEAMRRSPGSLLALRVLEYDLGYFEAAGAEPPESTSDTVSRERYLSDEYADTLMKDVVSLTVAAPETEVELAGLLLSAAGFPPPEHMETVGVSRLTVGPGATAVWAFPPVAE